MGCGCNRNPNPNPNNMNLKLNPVNKTVSQNLIKANTVSVPQITKSNPDIKKQICKGCQFSTKNPKGIFDENARCRKSNKSIIYILKDSTFHCPVQKF